MSSRINPCALCGYHNPGEICPHCERAPKEKSLEKPVVGFLGGIWTGVVAVPRGMTFLLKTKGIKRWLFPPLLLTGTSLALTLFWMWSLISAMAGESLPENFELGPPSWEWLGDLSEKWEWVGTVVGSLTTAANWLVNHFYGLIANRFSGFIVYMFFSVLASWYIFSIAYEAFAGPFLDEIQARLEITWFGRDPRSTIERPTDLPANRCFQLSMFALVPACIAIVLGFLTPFAWWIGLLALPVCFGVAVAIEPRFGTWLAWLARIEGGAILVSLKASFVTFLILFFTWPLYFFFPPFGYILFAVICGFATSVSLLDIPCERRGWSLRQRLRFLRRNLFALTAFGIVSGLLLAVPIIGVLVMVPSASIGGLWLLCRLDKSEL